MNKYKIIRIAAWTVFVVAFCCWGYTKLLYLDADVTYTDLANKVVTLSDEEPKSGTQPEINENTADTEPMLEIDHKQLTDINRDYVCWLSACGNKISYPVVKGRTNDEYLHHTFFGDKSFVGSIFIDYRCNADLNDFQTIIYGHSMKDRTMFRLIADYTDKAFAEQYPYIYIYTPNGRQKYEIFSVYDVKDTELMTALNNPSQEEKEAFISAVKQKSLYTISTEPSADDKIISLITCDVRDDSKRVVVNAKKIAD